MQSNSGWLRYGVLALVLGLCAEAAVAQAARTRPGGGSSGGSSATRVSGRATWGYTRGGHGYHGHHRGYYGYYGRYGYYPYYWGWGWWSPLLYYPYIHRPPVYDARVWPDLPAVVETDVKPKRASVLVDGEVVGEARDYNGNWDLLYLEPGAHLIEFQLEGHQTLRLAMDLSDGTYYRLHEKLQKGSGIDARSIEAPPPAPAAEPREGAPTLRSALLDLEVTPLDAAVYLDGEFLAEAGELARLHGSLPVAAGKHIVEVVRPGYRTERRELVVEGEKPVRVSIRLTRE